MHFNFTERQDELAESPHTGPVQGVGGVSSGGLYLDNNELNRISTTGILTLGSNQTYDVIVKGASHTKTAISETRIEAENDITFTGAASSFVTKFGAYANDDVTIATGTSVTTPQAMDANNSLPPRLLC